MKALIRMCEVRLARSTANQVNSSAFQQVCRLS